MKMLQVCIKIFFTAFPRKLWFASVYLGITILVVGEPVNLSRVCMYLTY